jgi:hypothetical protein
MTKTCPCGKPFTASRSDARFCSSACRSAAHRGGLVVVSAADADAPDTALVAVVRADLEAAGCLDTPLGQAALELALAMGPRCPAAAMARLAKQLEATLAAAKHRTKISAPQALRDELARRRAAEIGGAS